MACSAISQQGANNVPDLVPIGLLIRTPFRKLRLRKIQNFTSIKLFYFLCKITSFSHKFMTLCLKRKCGAEMLAVCANPVKRRPSAVQPRGTLSPPTLFDVCALRGGEAGGPGPAPWALPDVTDAPLMWENTQPRHHKHLQAMLWVMFHTTPSSPDSGGATVLLAAGVRLHRGTIMALRGQRSTRWTWRALRTEVPWRSRLRSASSVVTTHAGFQDWFYSIISGNICDFSLIW